MEVRRLEIFGGRVVREFFAALGVLLWRLLLARGHRLDSCFVSIVRSPVGSKESAHAPLRKPFRASLCNGNWKAGRACELLLLSRKMIRALVRS